MRFVFWQIRPQGMCVTCCLIWSDHCHPTSKSSVCVLAVTCSKWIGNASIPPTSCLFCCPLSSPVGSIFIEQTGIQLARNALVTWSAKTPSIRRPGLSASKASLQPHFGGVTTTQKKLLTGWISSCYMENSWGYYCTCSFEEFGSLT